MGVPPNTEDAARFVTLLLVYALLTDEVARADTYRAQLSLLRNSEEEDDELKNGKKCKKSEQKIMLLSHDGVIDFHMSCWGLVSDVDLELENPEGYQIRDMYAYFHICAHNICGESA